MSIPKKPTPFWDPDVSKTSTPIETAEGPVEEVEIQTLYITNTRGQQASIQLEPGDTLDISDTEINGSVRRESTTTEFRFYVDKLIAWKVVTQKVTRPVRR